MLLPKEILNDKEQLILAIRFRDFAQIRNMVAARKRVMREKNISAAPLSDSLEYIEAAIIRGDLEVAQYLIDNGALLDDIKNKNTALHLAVYHGQVKILRQLALDERQFNVKNAISDFGFLFLADKENFIMRSEKYFKQNMNPAQIEANKDGLKAEIDAFLVVTLGTQNAQNKENWQNFTQAVLEAYGQFTKPRRMLNPNEYDKSALKIAKNFEGNEEAKNYMIQLVHGMESYFSFRDPTALKNAAMIHISDSMLPAKVTIHEGSGTYSDTKGHDSAALYLQMQEKYSEDEKKHYEAVEKRQKETNDFFSRINSPAVISEVDLLKFAQKFSINITDGYQYGQNSLLHKAVEAGRPELVDILVQNGACVNIMNNEGLNAVGYAQKMLQNAQNSGSAKLGEYQKICDYFARELPRRKVSSPNPIVADPIGVGLVGFKSVVR